MADKQEVQNASFNHMRDLLTLGCTDLLVCIPRGDALVIKLAFARDGEVVPIEVNDPHARLDLLADFVAAVRSLAVGRTPEQVKRIMANGVAQRIVSGDDSWAQELLD